MIKICQQCGKEFETSHKNQMYCSVKCKANKNIQDLTGQKFGRLTAIKKIAHIKNRSIWECKCECGNKVNVSISNLKNGNTKSCGCLHKEKTSNANSKHKLTNSRIYNIWSSMKQRCFYDKYKEYNNYGGRGITICQEWLDDFMNFYNWAMANGYRDDLTIDRIDVNGDYCSENCHWIQLEEQARNKRNNVFYTFKNKTHCVSEWARILNISEVMLRKRLYRGWDFEKAISEPKKEQYNATSRVSE